MIIVSEFHRLWSPKRSAPKWRRRRGWNEWRLRRRLRPRLKIVDFGFLRRYGGRWCRRDPLLLSSALFTCWCAMGALPLALRPPPSATTTSKQQGAENSFNYWQNQSTLCYISNFCLIIKLPFFQIFWLFWSKMYQKRRILLKIPKSFLAPKSFTSSFWTECGLLVPCAILLL